MAIDFTFDDLVYDHRYHNQYLFGPSILVAPVESSKDLVQVYLPEREWYDLFTDRHHAGSREIVADCPIEQLPVFVRGSAIIPMRERAGVNTRDYGDVLEVHLYKGMHVNTFTLYDDDGSSFDHEQGNFAKRNISYNPIQSSLTLTATEGNYTSQRLEALAANRPQELKRLEGISVFMNYSKDDHLTDYAGQVEPFAKLLGDRVTLDERAASTAAGSTLRLRTTTRAPRR